MTPEHDYFFFLYLGYVGCQVILAAIGLFHYPGEPSLQIRDLPDQTEYSVSADPSLSITTSCSCHTAVTNDCRHQRIVIGIREQPDVFA